MGDWQKVDNAKILDKYVGKLISVFRNAVETAPLNYNDLQFAHLIHSMLAGMTNTIQQQKAYIH